MLDSGTDSVVELVITGTLAGVIDEEVELRCGAEIGEDSVGEVKYSDDNTVIGEMLELTKLGAMVDTGDFGPHVLVTDVT
jgi:hypothetical protein